MQCTYFRILLLCYFTEWKLAQCRQYDVNAEALRLFGEDLTMLLKRFRRTPEYLEILNRKKADLDNSMHDMMIQVKFAYEDHAVTKSVNETLYNEFNDEKDKDKTRLRSAPSFDGLPFDMSLFLRANGEEDKTNNITTTTLSPVEMLDAHGLLHLPLSVAERNAFKDVGYKVAGTAIQKMIQAMGPDEDDSEKKSTRMPSDDKKEVTTTTKHQEVTSEKPVKRADDPKATYGYRLGNITKENKAQKWG